MATVVLNIRSFIANSSVRELSVSRSQLYQHLIFVGLSGLSEMRCELGRKNAEKREETIKVEGRDGKGREEKGREEKKS